ncbi:MAG: hypothetical protein KDB51_07040 [Propionibacteriaceae bacterium]|uniref:Uncharacterized protein n=1 Tax=Micropruina glycogenica TaxID=75385 RepID=A0A2N9JM05_9ACTN|nr:hypothetical protein [Micropruina glycogenica]MCB0891580.1 hypothetical protein [Propionibacteriaceae bacterium]SPD88497.1 protein of unknown function [Micropruina glycogenica]
MRALEHSSTGRPAWLTSLEGYAGLLLDAAGRVTGTGLTGPGRTLR